MPCTGEEEGVALIWRQEGIRATRAKVSEDNLPFISSDHRCCTCLTIIHPTQCADFLPFYDERREGRRDAEMGASESPEFEVPMTMVRPVIVGLD